MGSRVNRALAILLATFLGASGLRANFTPAAWRYEPLPTAGTSNSEWYFFPDELANPRMLVKATTARGHGDARALAELLTVYGRDHIVWATAARPGGG